MTLKKLSLQTLAALFAAHTIMAVGQPIPFRYLIKLKNYPLGMTTSLLTAYLIIEFIDSANKLLNKSFPWKKDYLDRLGRQILLCMVLPLLLMLVFAFLYFRALGPDIFETSYFDLHFPLLIQMLALLNAIYMLGDWISTYDSVSVAPPAPPVAQLVVEVATPEAVPVAQKAVPALPLKIQLENGIHCAGIDNGIRKIWESLEGYTTSEKSLRKIAAGVDLSQYLFIRNVCLVRLDNISRIEDAPNGQCLLTTTIPAGRVFVISRRQAIKLEGLQRSEKWKAAAP